MNEWEWEVLENRMPVEQARRGNFKAGQRVRLRPRAGGDVLDLALAGQMATIEAVEEDYEGHCHLAVVLDEDPGRDLGFARQPGHRFFFTPAEVEPIEDAAGAAASAHADRPVVLVAGIGNVFFGDDGFGVEVARRLQQRPALAHTRVVDFGIRGFDLVCALDTAEVIVLVDAYPHGAAPGTVTVIEPDVASGDVAASEPALVEPHRLDPVSVLRMAHAIDVKPGRLFLVGCEPDTLGGEDGTVGLSTPVEAAVDRAVALIETMTEGFVRAARTA